MTELSPFPDGYITVELYIDGAWRDVSTRLHESGVKLTRGRTSWGALPPVALARLSLKDDDGELTPTNPMATWFGYLTRNTPCRIAVTPAGGTKSYRCWGVVSEWPLKHSMKGESGAYVDLEVSDAWRRVRQGDPASRSALRHLISAWDQSTLIGYWPCEDAAGSTTLECVTGLGRAKILGTPSLAADSTIVGSDSIMVLGSARVTMVPLHVPAVAVQLRWAGHIGAGTPSGSVIARVIFDEPSYFGRFDLIYTSASGGSLTLAKYYANGSSIGSNTWAFGLDGVDGYFSVNLAEVVPGTLTFEVGMLRADTGVYGSGTGSVAIAGYHLEDAVRSIVLNPNLAALTDVAVGHVTYETATTSLATVAGQVLTGYDGETAPARIYRLGVLSGATSALLTDTIANSVAMGPQLPGSLVALIDEAVKSDQGFLFSSRAADQATCYMSGEYAYNLGPHDTLTLGYLDNMLMEPETHTDSITNRVQVTRDGGGSATAADHTGPLGIDTVGLYDTSETLSLHTDDQVDDQANWRMRWSTIDLPSWKIGADLAHPTYLASVSLTADVLLAHEGTWLTVTGIPLWLHPDNVIALVIGYSEEITPKHHRLVFETVPPLFTTEWDDTSGRYVNETTTVSTAVATTGATSIVVAHGADGPWAHDDGDYDLVLGGERVTVTAVGAAVAGVQTLTVTRAVNTIAKTHAVGTAVGMYNPRVHAL